MANVYLWAICGQSNAQGTPGGPGPPPGGAGTAYIVAPAVTHPTRALEWEASGGLQELKDNRTGTALSAYQGLPGSAWPAFMNVMTASTTETHVIIRCPRGGSSVLAANTNPSTGDWSTSGVRFPAAITRIQSAISAIAAAGHTLVGVHVIWHGGERDALEGNNLAAFQTEFEALLGRFRTALSRPTLKMYVARVGQATRNDGSSNYSPTVLARLAQVRGWQDAACAAVDGMEMAYTDCVNFPTYGWMRSDGAHYIQSLVSQPVGSNSGYNAMGNGIGTFVAADIGGDPPPPDPPDRDPIIGRTARLLRRAAPVPPPPMAGPAQFATIGTLKTHSTVTAVDAPAGVVEDNVVLLVALSNFAVTFTWPAGFTQCAAKQQGSATIAAAYKIAAGDGTDDDTDTYTVVPSSGSFTAQALRFTGVDVSGSPVRGVSTAGGTSEQNTSLVGVPAGDILVHAAGLNNGAYAPPTPAGYVDRNSSAVRMNIATKDQTVTGDTGNVNGGAVSGSLPVPSFLLALKGAPA